MMEGHLPVSRQWFSSCLTTSIFHLIVAPEAVWTCLIPRLSSGLPWFYTSSSKHLPLHHPLFLWQYPADNLQIHWGLPSLRGGALTPLPLQEGRKPLPKSELSWLWEFFSINSRILQLISHSLLNGVFGHSSGVWRSKSTKKSYCSHDQWSCLGCVGGERILRDISKPGALQTSYCG